MGANRKKRGHHHDYKNKLLEERSENDIDILGEGENPNLSLIICDTFTLLTTKIFMLEEISIWFLKCQESNSKVHIE